MLLAKDNAVKEKLITRPRERTECQGAALDQGLLVVQALARRDYDAPLMDSHEAARAV